VGFFSGSVEKRMSRPFAMQLLLCKATAGGKQSRGESAFPLVSKKGIDAFLGKFD